MLAVDSGILGFISAITLAIVNVAGLVLVALIAQRTNQRTVDIKSDTAAIDRAVNGTKPGVPHISDNVVVTRDNTVEQIAIAKEADDVAVASAESMKDKLDEVLEVVTKKKKP